MRATSAKRVLGLAFALAAGGCASILGIEKQTFDDADGGDSGMNAAVREGGTEGGGDSALVTPDPDSSAPDAPVDTYVPPGFVPCAGTSGICNVAGGECCCVTAFGTTTAGGGVESLAAPSSDCDLIDGGTSCGGSSITSGSFTTITFQFAQECSRRADCPDGNYCCALVGDAGMGIDFVDSMQCATTCAGVIVCHTASDCPGPMQCVPETVPILSGLWSGTCQ